MNNSNIELACNVLDARYKKSNLKPFKDAIIELFELKLVGNPPVILGRVQPEEVLVALHETSKNSNKTRAIKQVLEELLIEFSSTEHNVITFYTIKSLEEIHYKPVQYAIKNIVERSLLTDKYYNGENLELLATNLLKYYNVSHQYLAMMLDNLHYNSDKFVICNYLDVFINKEYSTGVVECFKKYLSESKPFPFIEFASSLFVSANYVMGSKLFDLYNELLKQSKYNFKIGDVDDLFMSLIEYSKEIDTDWLQPEYWHAILCTIKTNRRSLTQEDYLLFANSISDDDSKLFRSINSFLKSNGNENFVHGYEILRKNKDIADLIVPPRTVEENGN